MKMPVDPGEKALLAEVDKEMLMDYTRQIACEIRLSGSEEELRSVQYLRKTLQEFGLSTQLLFSQAYISLPGPAFLEINGQEVQCITHSMATSTSEHGLSAPLVYVGKAGAFDFVANNIKGKIALIEGLAIRGAVIKVQQEGAAGAIFINGKYTHEMILSPVWGNPTPETFGLLPKIPAFSVNNDAGDFIKKELAQGKTVNAWLKTSVDTGWRAIPTLTAEIKGSREPDKFVLLSGHVDSWHLGVMDNGTANAVMLEIARILAKNQDKLRRSLRLAFWSGHSHGRYAGSAWYCDEYWEDLHDNCILHLNVDSVGAKGATIMTEGNIMAATKDFAANIIYSLTGDVFTGRPFGRGGDQSFWGPGVPSMFMTLSEQEKTGDLDAKLVADVFNSGPRSGGLGWWWHTTEDIMDKIDSLHLERDCEVYLSATYHACADKIIPVNPLAAIKEMQDAILGYQQRVREKRCFVQTLQRLDELEQIVSTLYSYLASNLSDEKISLVNLTFQHVVRVLVQLNYVSGPVFDHDPAMAQPLLPALSKIEELVQEKTGSDRYYQLQTYLKRRVNQVNFALRQALIIAGETKARLSV